MPKDDNTYTLTADDKACSIGLLRGVESWPAKEMPEWANTTAKRLTDMGVGNSRIKEVIQAMEVDRRAKVRASLGNPPITEFDEHLADLLNRFGIKI